VAPTGIAASHIGGQTIHLWAGIGLGKDNMEKMCEKVEGSDPASGRWREADVLVIDEVSVKREQELGLTFAFFPALTQPSTCS
jgi:ATP-dependent DNA helicase PIF1